MPFEGLYMLDLPAEVVYFAPIDPLTYVCTSKHQEFHKRLLNRRRIAPALANTKKLDILKALSPSPSFFDFSDFRGSHQHATQYSESDTAAGDPAR